MITNGIKAPALHR